jgi:arylsulfatase A-like enzyme
MTTPTRLVPSLFALLLSIAATLPAQEVIRPNVLFIAVDDLVPRIGPYGDSIANTPRMDQLAGTGLTFLNHRTQWAVCGPSRAALTTSLTPEETNVIGFKKIRDKNFLPNVVTLPQHFRNQGYETA